MIHKYKLNGYDIVMDVNSGGVHVVDDVTYDLLDYIEPPMSDKCLEDIKNKLIDKYSKEQIESSYSEILELYKENTLFSEDVYEKYAKYSVAAPVKAMCLLVSMDCNLRCKYCFASTGDFGLGRKLMSYETGKQAIDYLLENSGDRKNLELDFFGGEPLMNWEVVKKVVLYARSREAEYGKKFRFTVTTNGTLLTEDKIEFINKEMSNVVLSIDGRKEVNDRMRVNVEGKGCHDQIIENYKKLVDKRGSKEYYIRGTYTKYNLDFADDVLYFNEQGFDQLSIEPVVCEPEKPYALKEEDLPKIYSEYDRLADAMLKKDKEGKHFNFFHFMIDLDQGPCAIKRLRGCSCGNEYVAITPDGDIYPCHQFVGMDEWKMGNLHEGTFDIKIKEYFAKANIYSKEECKKCWARFYCSGGCNANNYQYAGDIHNAYKMSCKIEQKRLECAIMIKVAHAVEAGE